MSTRWHRILQVGVVRIDADGVVTDEWSSLVRLRWPLSRVGPTHVHGITRAMLKAAPSLDEVLDDLATRVDGAIFTAHNARFDGEFLRRAARRRPPTDPLRAGLDRRLCTLRMSRRLDPDRERSHRLADLADRYGVPLDRPHDALADATATAQVLPFLLAAHGVETVDDLAPFFDRPPAPRSSRRRPRTRDRLEVTPIRTAGAPRPVDRQS